MRLNDERTKFRKLCRKTLKLKIIIKFFFFFHETIFFVLIPTLNCAIFRADRYPKTKVFGTFTLEECGRTCPDIPNIRENV